MTGQAIRRRSSGYSGDLGPPPISALHTGPASGVWILDEDGPEADDGSSTDLQQQVWRIADDGRQRSPAGREAGTDTLRYPSGAEIKSQNKITLSGYGKVPIDVRGIGGYAITPPSNHFSGRRYEVGARSGDDADRRGSAMARGSRPHDQRQRRQQRQAGGGYSRSLSPVVRSRTWQRQQEQGKASGTTEH